MAGGSFVEPAGPLAHYAGPAGIEVFRDIDDLDLLGGLDEPHRLRLGSAMRSPAAAPLFRPGSLPERVRSLHGARVAVPGPAVLGVAGYELGGFGLLQRHGRVLLDSQIQPHGFNEKFTPSHMPPHWARGLLRPDAEIVACDEPVGVVLNTHLIYGHFLLEMLARVHVLAGLAVLGRPIRVAVPSDAPGWVRAFIGLYFAPDRIIAYDSQRQRVRAPCFVLPTMMMLHYLLHPLMNLVVGQLLDRVAARPAAGGRRLYLSRSRHDGWHALANEAEVEGVMGDLGFTVVHPQELDLPAQLALFAWAECIVSPYSSAAHNALFAPMGTPVFCFGWMNRCQSGIAALRRQPVGFMPASDGAVVFPPADRPPGVFRQHIDSRALAREVPEFLRFAAQQREVPEAPRAAQGLDTATLTRAPWRYGHDGARPAAEALQFLPDGRIGGYGNPNERGWVLRQGVLSILDAQGRTTVTFGPMEHAPGLVVLRGRFLLDPRMELVLRLERDRVG